MCWQCGDSLTPYHACCAPEPPDECPECGGEIEATDDEWRCTECVWPAGEDWRSERDRREDAEIEKWEASRDE